MICFPNSVKVTAFFSQTPAPRLFPPASSLSPAVVEGEVGEEEDGDFLPFPFEGDEEGEGGGSFGSSGSSDFVRAVTLRRSSDEVEEFCPDLLLEAPAPAPAPPAPPSLPMPPPSAPPVVSPSRSTRILERKSGPMSGWPRIDKASEGDGDASDASIVRTVGSRSPLLESRKKGGGGGGGGAAQISFVTSAAKN